MTAAAADTPLPGLAARLATPRQALAAMYTGRLAHADSSLGLNGLLVAAEAFSRAAEPDAAVAPLTPPMMLQALAYALEEHHAAALARLGTYEQWGYLQALEDGRGALEAAAAPAWADLKAAVDRQEPLPHVPGQGPHDLLRALHGAVAAWLASAGRAS